jgi:hypothetical protein
MSEFEINYDTRPYLPDIIIKDNIYNSCDSINNNNSIEINSTIFIVNINKNLDFSDPGYILFGIKNDNLNPLIYEFPPLYFFYYNSNNLTNKPYKITYETNTLSENLKSILQQIGYSIDKINGSSFIYKELLVTEEFNQIQKKVLYFYFKLTNIEPTENYVNYNRYLSSFYTNDSYYNILIYPFYNKYQVIYENLQINFNYYFTTNQNTNNYLDNLDFDDREIIKYYEKIDYKYFENTNYTMDLKTNIETLRNYTFNIKNYLEYVKSFKSKNVISSSINELSKINYPTTDYGINNKLSYSNIVLNKNHINNNISYSNQYNKYSYTMDKKFGNLAPLFNNKLEYSIFHTKNVSNETTFQQVRNYYLNFYYDINKINSVNQMIKLNSYLLKIFLIINPFIINLNYVLNKVNTSIYPLYDNSNILSFGSNKEKLNIFILGNIKSIEIYYIEKYKIIFEYETLIGEKLSNIIILSIAFYNSNLFNILNTSITNNINDLGFVNYTTIDQNISLSPAISLFTDNLKINEKLYDYNFESIRYYYNSIDYSKLSSYPSAENIIDFLNFYNFIPNILTQLKTPENKYYNNLMDVLLLRVNSFIKNFINIEQNYKTFISESFNLKKYLNINILWDNNILLNNNVSNFKNIEYYSYFPKINLLYQTVEEKFSGKYYPVLKYPYNSLNISSFQILPAGNYLKFNYVNYFDKEISKTQNFVKSINEISLMINHNYSLFIKLPYNINEDDSFYCESKDYYSSNYSMNIGGNLTEIYLVLTDIYGNPYTFYGDNPISEFNINGLIYGIKMYDYFNYFSDNLKLSILLNIYFNDYINLSKFTLISELCTNYTDSNIFYWDINNSNYNLHNFNSLKEIILFDFKRFKNSYNSETIIEYSKNFNYKYLEILYNNKSQLNKLRYDIKISLYLANTYKIITLIKKIYNYLEIIKINIILGYYKNDYIINIIRYNTSQIINLLEINYNFYISNGTFKTDIYREITMINNINISNTLEKFNEYQILLENILNYITQKIESILEIFSNNMVGVENVFYNLYKNIYESIGLERINLNLEEEILNDINNLTNDLSIEILDSFEYLTIQNKNNLINQVNAYLKIIILNLTKIDELYNLAKLMGDKTINIFLPENLSNNVVKNTYIYNTDCYQDISNVPKFNIINFLNDTKDLILYQSLPANNPDSYLIYQKCILEGIIVFIDNTKTYFEQVINKIVHIYNYIQGIIDIDKINIFLPDEIANFYSVLGLFQTNYYAFFEILFENQIDVFYEYIFLKTLFNNLYNSCEEFLLYVRVKNDFLNPNLIEYTNIFVNEDLYKIIHLDTFYNFTLKTLNSIDLLVIKKNPELSIIYLEKVKNINSLFEGNKLFNLIVNLINGMILEFNLEIETGIKVYVPINYFSFYIIPYYDLLLFKEIFKPASFNFNNINLDMIFNVNNLNLNIFYTYYVDEETNVFYKNALNYSYLSTPYKYINIANTQISS